MTPQSSQYTWGSLGNNPAALNGLGVTVSHTPGVDLRAEEELTEKAQPAHPSVNHSFAELNYLYNDLEAITERAKGLIAQLSPHQLQFLQKRAQGTLGCMVTAIQSRIEGHVKLSASTRSGKPNGKCRYWCPSCKTEFKLRGTYKRHVQYFHTHQYHYCCIDPNCPWEGYRKDKVHEHVRAKHRELGDLTDVQIKSVQTEQPSPSHCEICEESVDSWDSFFNCMAAHCELPDGNSPDSNGSGNNNINGGNGNSFNGQRIPDSGSGKRGSHTFHNGHDSSFACGNPAQSSFGDCISYNEGNPDQRTSATDIYVGSQFPNFPGSMNALDDFDDHSLGELASVGIPKVQNTAGSPELDKLLRVEKAPTVAAVENAGIYPELCTSRPNTSQTSAALSSSDRSVPTWLKRPKRQLTKSHQSGSFKKSCKSCDHSAQSCFNCPSLKRGDGCRTSVDKLQQLQAQPGSAPQDSGQSQNFGKMIPNGAPLTLNHNEPLDQTMSFFSTGVGPSSGEASVGTPRSFGYSSQISQLSSPIEAFQLRALEARSNEPYFLGIRNMPIGTCGTAPGPVQDTSAQPSWGTISLPPNASSFDWPDDSFTRSFDDMGPFDQITLQPQREQNRPTSSSLNRSISQPYHQGGHFLNRHWDSTCLNQGLRTDVSDRPTAQPKG